MLKVVYNLEDTTLISEVTVSMEQVEDLPDGVVLPKSSGWKTHVIYMTDEDIQEDRGPTGRWDFERELTELEMAALLALASGLGELTNDGDREKVAATVTLFYDICEPLLVNCPQNGRPIP